MRNFFNNLRLAWFALLALLTGSEVMATVPLDFPENDWPYLSALIADRTIPPDWRAPDGSSIVALQMVYGSEAAAVDYLKRAKRAKVWMEGPVGEQGRLMTGAVMQGKEHVVRTLLSFGETPNAISPLEDSPLMLAASGGKLEIMRMLIEAGADINYSTPSSRLKAIHYALRSGRYLAVRLLVDAGVDLDKFRANELQDSLVIQAIIGGNINSLRFLQDNEFDMKARRADGDTPLTYAVLAVAPYNMVSNLLYTGDPCIKDKDGRLPENIAVMKDSRYEQRRAEYGDLLKHACARSRSNRPE